MSEQVANLRSRIETRDEQIESLKAKLADADENNDDDGEGQRHQLVGRLTAQYLNVHPEASQRIRMGLDMPPEEWMNAELEKLGESWRIGKRQIRNLRARWG